MRCAFQEPPLASLVTVLDALECRRIGVVAVLTYIWSCLPPTNRSLSLGEAVKGCGLHAEMLVKVSKYFSPNGPSPNRWIALAKALMNPETKMV